MKCGICGYDNEDNSEVCSGCGAVINDDKKEKFGRYSEQNSLFVCRHTISGVSQLRNTFKGLASTATLRGAALFQTLAFIFTALTYVILLNRAENYFAANDIFHIDSIKTYEIFGEIVFWIAILPGLLTVIGIWISIFSASGKKEYVTPIGIGMIRIAKYIEMIIVMCIICVLMVSQIAKGIANIVALLTILVILVVLVFAIIYYNGVFVSIKNITYSISNEEPSEILSRVVYIFCMVFSLISFLSGIAALFLTGNIVMGLAGLSGAVAKGMFAVFIVKYNLAMDWLYHNSWDERY